MLSQRNGKAVSALDNWPPPKNKARQWQDGRSAKELARAWTMVPGRCTPPADLEALINSHAAFSGARIVSGTPEDHVTFDEFSGPRNADLNLVCESPRGRIVICIEAKADESYGGTVGAQLRAAKRRTEAGQPSNAASRAEALYCVHPAPRSAAPSVPTAHGNSSRYAICREGGRNDRIAADP